MSEDNVKNVDMKQLFPAVVNMILLDSGNEGLHDGKFTINDFVISRVKEDERERLGIPANILGYEIKFIVQGKVIDGFCCVDVTDKKELVEPGEFEVVE
jgi:hypothetical protein